MRKNLLLAAAALGMALSSPAMAQTAGEDEAALNDPVTGRGSIARILSQRDPFAWHDAIERHTGRARERSLGEAMLALVTEPAGESTAALQEWLSANASELDAGTLIFLSAMYGERLMETGEYQRALSVFRQVSTAIPEAAPNFENGIGILEQFGEAGPTRSTGASGATVPATQDNATLLNIPVTINGHTIPMIADTGAEYSLISHSTAQMLGLESIESSSTIGTSTNEALEAGFTVVPEIRIGGMEFENVAFTIIPDEALQFSAADSDNLDEEYEITGVLGLPVFVAAGRIAWLDNGQQIALGSDAPAVSEGGQIYWHREGLGLEVDFGDGPVPVFFDSGARVSQTSIRGLIEVGVDSETLENRTVTTGGGGGFAEENVLVLPSITFGLSGYDFVLEDASVYPSEGNPELADGGYAGSDILKRVGLFAIDFETMRYRAEE